MKENFYLSHLFSKTRSQSGDLSSNESFSIDGVTNKSFFLLSLVSLGVAFSWNLASSGSGYVAGGMGLSSIVTLVLVMIATYNPEMGYILVPIIAVLEGILVGMVSILFESLYPGIVLEAVGVTGATFFGLLFAYKTSLVEVNDTFRNTVVSAVFGIFCFYILNFVLSFFGIYLYSSFGSGLLQIGLNLVIAVVAALNLVMNFDFIYRGSQDGLPKYLEWNSSLGLLIALVWMYIEVIQLLARLRSE